MAILAVAAAYLIRIGDEIEQAIATLLGGQADRAADVAASYREQFHSRRQGGVLEPLYPGARAAIDSLHARDDVLLGIATGKAMRGVRHMMDTHDLNGRFVTYQTADTSPSKPHPDMVLRAMAETGAEPERTLMIGDTGFDMAMAKAAGAHALGVTWGYHDHSRLADQGADRIIHSFGDLDRALLEILKIDKETI